MLSYLWLKAVIIEMSEQSNMADGDSLNEVNSDREVDANAADADIDDDEVIAARYQSYGSA